MKDISKFFDRFKNIKPPEESVKKIAKKVIKQTTNIELLDNEISFKNNNLYLNTLSVKKFEIQLQKLEIIRILKEEYNIFCRNIF